jgi:hypothetical protein
MISLNNLIQLMWVTVFYVESELGVLGLQDMQAKLEALNVCIADNQTAPSVFD